MRSTRQKIEVILEEERIGRLTRELAMSMDQWGQIEPEGGWEPRVEVQPNGRGNRIVMAYGGSGFVVEVLINPLQSGTFEEHTR